MTEGTKVLRISKLAKEFNIGVNTIVEFLGKKGISISSNPNTKITPEAYEILAKEFQKEKTLKDEVRKSGLSFSKRDSARLEEEKKIREQVEQDQKEPEPVEDEYDDEEEEEEKQLFIQDIKSLMTETKKTDDTPENKEEPKTKGPKIIGKLSEDQLGSKKASTKKKETKQKGTQKSEEKQPEEKPSSDKKQDKPSQDITEKDKKESETPPAKEPEVEPAPELKTEKPDRQEETKVEKDTSDKEKTHLKEEQQKEKTEEEEKPNIAQVNKDQSEPAEEKTNAETDQNSDKTTEKKDLTAEEPQKSEPEKENKETEKPVAESKKPMQKENKAPAKEETPVKNDEPKKEEKKQEENDRFMKTEVEKLEGVTILGKIDLPSKKEKSKKQPVASSSDTDKIKRRKRKRIKKEKTGQDQQKQEDRNTNKQQGQGKKTAGKEQNQQQRQDRDKKSDRQNQNQSRNKKGSRRDQNKQEVSDEEISKQIRETLASLSGAGKSKGSKHRRLKRDLQQKQRIKEAEEAETDQKKLQVTEFISANELANMIEVPVTEIISTCMNLGLFVSINQRLDAETITIVADEFGYDVEFVSVDDQKMVEEVLDDPQEMEPRAPIVTVMGHVDHGKTSLLDQIRHANVIAGEAGGITQHIGAYSVQLEDGKMISFLDTPGHEAFTAMRARGARVTDVVIVVVAADDNVMPQTVEAINHAQAAGVPIVIAINKVDKPTANPDKVKEELANINILVEDWGGKYQSQEISAKNGVNIEKLLEKVLLEAELLDLKANPNRMATGTVIESSLDKGRGYLATMLVQTGTLEMGDIVVAGNTHGRVKAMFNERNQRITEAGPSTPVLLLGLDGAPQAGDNFNVVKDEQEAKSITSKRQQLIREQGLRTQKHITLDEIGRRIAIGDFKELNIIIKGDVDGSVEALADSMLKLSTEEVQVNIIHKAVGSITEGDVLLASASNAIIVGFQVRPSLPARKLAENEEIDIRIYSVIYNAISEIKSAIEGMLSPEIEEKIVANLEVRETFKISKVGTIAGCMVLDGKIHRNSNIRVIRDGIVVYTGYLGSLKRYKDDVKEVASGYECGLNVDKFNDIKQGDIIEAFETVEVARKLE